ncbi:hypothetical protein OR1_02998 [Geobacter sp. OR-1]|uniref:VPLPA-CTERM sorting domain-containing protein n=1 Tax=Geobacter sp. OR-1 TaxID=1266765 RepID=UPI000541D094|nr:VPLPA-CTERM sorting domain-containing protein [Geobacter sp. OR-1]GAM10705.1 hypothetical protein OR1_02998 [Geobacter sp. OR-1]
MKNKSLLFAITFALLVGLCGNASAYTYQYEVFGSNDLGDPQNKAINPLNAIMHLTAGQSVSVTNVQGQFMLGLYDTNANAFHSRGFVNPDGTSTNAHFNQQDLTYNGSTFHIGSLVGQVGSDYYTIGSGSTFTAKNSGDLKLLMWGLPSGSPSTITGHTIFAETHCGGVTADVSATPIPGAAWLLGSGIIGLIGLKRRNSTKA